MLKPIARGLPAGLSPAVRAVPGVLALLLALSGARAYAALRPGWQAVEERRLVLSASDLAPGSLSSAFTPGVQAWAPEILQWSEEHALEPALVATVMQIESCGSTHATSSAGAMGLFQVMPFHFHGNEDPYDPATNALRGLNYLAGALQLSGGRVDLALAGYNAGHSAILLPPAEWPTETQRYVYWGAGILDDIAAGRIPSPRLEEWARAGGDHLCAETRSVALAPP